MYYELYVKSNTKVEMPQIQEIDIEQMMKLSDFDSAEFLTTIETRCVSKIRLMFFDWLEKVVGQTINNVTLFKSQPAKHVHHTDQNKQLAMEKMELYEKA